MEANFLNSIIHKLPWGNARSQTKFGPDHFSRFDVYWIQTDRHTNKHVANIVTEHIFVTLNIPNYVTLYIVCKL